MAKPQTILIADANDGRRAIVESAVTDSSGLGRPLIALSAESAAERAEAAQPSVIVLGFPLPSMEPSELLPLIRRLSPISQVIMWSEELPELLDPDEGAVLLLPADASVEEVRQVLDEYASGNPSPNQSARSIYLGMPLPPKHRWRHPRS